MVRVPYPPNTNPPRHIVNLLGRADLGLAESAHADTGGPRDYAVAVRRETLDVVAFSDEVARGLLVGDQRARIVKRVAPRVLQDTVPGGRFLHLTFVSPTHFRIAGLDHLLPDALLLFGGLAVRWMALGWMELPKLDVKRVPACLLRYHLTSYVIKETVVSALIGTVEYDLLPCDDEGRRLLWLLARFAEWRGVGAHTSYGMGRVRIGTGMRGNVWESDE